MHGPLKRAPDRRGWWLEEETAAPVADPQDPLSARFRASEAQTRGPDDRPSWISVVWFVGILCWLAAAVFGVLTSNDLLIAAVPVSIVLVVLSTWVARWIAKLDNDPSIAPILVAGAVLKLLGSALKYSVSFGAYGGLDATTYDVYGRLIAKGLRHGELIDLGGRWAGTRFLQLVTGVVYTVSPASRISGCLIFAWFSFLGVVLFWRAFKRFAPHLNDRTYLLTLLLLPTLIYWPSSIGKEAFLMLCTGMATFGIACLLDGLIWRGVLTLALGIGGISMVRPHMGIVIFAGYAFATLLRAEKGRNVMATLVSVGAVVAVGALVLSQATAFFGIDSFSPESVSSTLEDANNRTDQGGSQFSPVQITSPANFVPGAVTVLFRPFPFEARSPQELATAVESIGLVIYTFLRRRDLFRSLRKMRKTPFAAFCVMALIAFVIIFSVIANFAILARQRSLVLPLYLMLLVPLRPGHEEETVEDKNTDGRASKKAARGHRSPDDPEGDFDPFAPLVPRRLGPRRTAQ